jgi:hypothetical protein
MGVLKSYCLVTSFSNQIFLMHSLVHLTLRSWLRSRNTFAKWNEAALTVLIMHFPSGSPETLAVSETCITHAAVVLKDCTIQRDTEGPRIELA